jgi:hypothetical protein
VPSSHAWAFDWTAEQCHHPQVTWQKTEDKPVVVTLAAASLIGIIALNAVADALNALPLVGGALEVVGICATSWFTYRYLVFGPDRCVQPSCCCSVSVPAVLTDVHSCRQELKQNVLDFVKKVQGK